MENGDIRLAIGVRLSWTHCPSDYHFSFTCMKKWPDYRLIKCCDGPIDVMANRIVQQALEFDCTHIIFLDADMTFQEDTIPRLLGHNKDIVGGLCFKKKPPFDPVLLEGEPYKAVTMRDYPPNELVEVVGTGLACLMVKAEVFDALSYPWFEFRRLPDGRMVGEDIGFCYSAIEAGYKVYVDTGVKTEHLSICRVGEDLHRLYRMLLENGLIDKRSEIDFPIQ